MTYKTHKAAAAVAVDHYVKEGDYWLETFQGDPLTEGFPPTRPGSTRSGIIKVQGKHAVPNHQAAPSRQPVHAVYELEWSGELWERLEAVGTGVPQRLHVILTAGVALLLSRYRGHEDVVLGTTIYKQETEAEFVNTVLPLRIGIDPGQSVKAFLMHVRRIIVAAVENQNYPMETLPARLNLVDDGSRFPLFDCAVLLEPIHDFRYLGDIPLNMVMSFERGAGVLRGTVHYNDEFYTQDTVERLMQHLARLLRAALGDLDASVTSFDLLDEEERRRVLVEFNGTGVPFPEDKTLDQLFVEQAERSGDRTAVTGAGTVTYAELNEQSDRMASALLEKGVGPESIVAIMAERSVETIIGILAILKAGGAYLPIDPDYPEERIQYMLSDSGATLLIDKSFSRETFCGAFTKATPRRAAGGALAYIMYTSGSTGKPKGVMVEHRNVVNVAASFARRYGVGEGVHVLLMSDFTFDPSVLQVFGALLHGAAVCMMDKQWLNDIPRLRRYIETRRVHVLNFVPDVLDKLLGEGKKLESIRCVLSGGETLDDRVKARILAKGYDLYNHYGPTETTVDALTGKCSERAVSLGKPIDNVRVDILDSYGKPAPTGMPGEIVIAGAGVARGYLNNPELTAEKFINEIVNSQLSIVNDQLEKPLPPDPSLTPYPLSLTPRLYRTGDQGARLPDGAVEFRGRMDHQVKVRGYRIELGEIEHRLMRYPGMTGAAVTAGENETGETFLCAYFSPPGADSHELRQFASRELPAYMVPSYYTPMESLPRLATGKIDRKALPDPKDSQWNRRPFQPPASDTETAIRRTWAEALGLEPETIGIDDDFFQLGGNSINILKVLNHVNQLSEKEIPMSYLFLHPTIRRLAAELATGAHPENAECIVRLNHGGHQKNLFIFHPLHGMVYPYKELAGLLADRINVYGVQARGFNGGAAPPGGAVPHSGAVPFSFKEMLDDYVQQIRAVQPEGPYLLAGYCIGNIFAYETARELEAAGQTVEPLVMLDISSRFAGYYTKYLKLKELLADIPFGFSRAKNRDLPGVEEAGDDEEQRKKRVEDNIDRVLRTYRYKRSVRAPLCVVKARDRKDPRLTEDRLAKMTAGEVILKETPGDHESLLESPHVETLAKIINEIV